MNRWRIHIQGQVQGVGFRPFVFGLAQQYGLNGWVSNTLEGVQIEFEAEEAVAQYFYKDCVDLAPILAHITNHSCRKRPSGSKPFSSFQIVQSSDQGTGSLLLSPDFGLCDACRKELSEEGNRRRGYAFTTCTRCGPRYSIISALPYDRDKTSMDPFDMCPSCRAEYQNPLDRRHFSQTNSCPSCGITMTMHCPNGVDPYPLDTDQLVKVLEIWETGGVVAIKGIGGYLLTCDAASPTALQRLRRLKDRPAKPFALMYPDLKSLENDAQLSADQKKVLGSPAAPIGIFRRKNPSGNPLAWVQIAPDLDEIGAMLPYTPLYELLLKQWDRPIVATSGNVSGDPIVFKDEEALNQFLTKGIFVLSNNREITIPQDDSVVRFTKNGEPLLLRRSRGYAPTLIVHDLPWSSETQLACGALLKSTVSLLHNRNTFVSQYLGNLEGYNTFCHFQQVVDHLQGVLQATPDRILVDLHPAYLSTQFGKKLADQLEVPLVEIQHHEAHFAAILAEHALVESEKPVLGMIWDGTGLGTDREVWGGECFSYQNGSIDRIGHIEPFPLLLGDKMAREPRIAALALGSLIPGSAQRLKNQFSDQEWSLYRRLLDREQQLQTTSVGRLFDAVASLLGLCERMEYEGQAAIFLEQEARRFALAHTPKYRPFELGWDSKAMVYFPTRQLGQAILNALEKGMDRAEIAFRFHLTLAEWPGRVALASGYEKIAFSGGVFQNTVLMEALQQRWGDRFQLFFHQQLSPNDENISFGQLAHWCIQQNQTFKTQEQHVLSYSGKD